MFRVFWWWQCHFHISNQLFRIYFWMQSKTNRVMAQQSSSLCLYFSLFQFLSLSGAILLSKAIPFYAQSLSFEFSLHLFFLAVYSFLLFVFIFSVFTIFSTRIPINQSVCLKIVIMFILKWMTLQKINFKLVVSFLFISFFSSDRLELFAVHQFHDHKMEFPCYPHLCVQNRHKINVQLLARHKRELLF